MKRLRRMADGILYHSPITWKMVMASVLLIVMPITLLTSYFYLHSAQIFKHQLSGSIRSAYTQGYTTISDQLDSIESFAFYYLFSVQLDELASGSPEDYSIAEQLTFRDSISILRPSENFGSIIADTYVYLRTSFPLLETSEVIYSFSDIVGEGWADYALSQKDTSLFISSQLYTSAEEPQGSIAADERLSFIRKVPSKEDYSVAAALIRFDFKKRDLDQLLKSINCTQSSQTGIVDENGQLVAGTANDQVMDTLPLKTIGSSDTEWWEGEVDGESYMVGMRRFGNTDWYYVSCIPERDILLYNTDVVRQFILLALIMLLCVGLYIAFISFSITHRIKRLAHGIHKSGLPQAQPLPGDGYRVEIGQLTGEYNVLLQRVNRLLETQRQNHEALRASEMRFLRAQMNPHFLYNTLELLRWYARNSDREMVDRIIDRLATFYKLSMNHGLEYYTVSDELHLVETYFIIMNMRFQGKIQLRVQVEEKILHCRIPVIFLQPFVENALLHGIMKKRDRTGIIQVSGRLEGGDLIFIIEDDGVGIDLAVMEQLNQSVPPSVPQDNEKGNHIGIANVIGRIRLLYGNGYGVHYSRPADGGTRVEVKIPAESL